MQHAQGCDMAIRLRSIAYQGFAFIGALVALIFIAAIIGSFEIPRPPTATPCTRDWFLHIEKHYFNIEDARPLPYDLGDNYWLDYTEHRANLKQSNTLNTSQRCDRIQQQLSKHRFIINHFFNVSWMH